MTTALTVATTAATAHGGGIPSPVTILLVIAAIGYVLWSRMQGRPLQARRLLVLPAVLTVIGIFDLTGSSAPHLGSKDIAFLVASITLSVVLGAARGATIELYPREGALWQRYRRRTVALWITLISAKLVLAALASAAHAQAGGGTNSLMLSLGLSLAAEAAIVGPRALSTGLPFAPHDDKKAPARPTQARPTRNQHVNDFQIPSNFQDPSTRNEPRRDVPAQWSQPEQSPNRRRPDRRPDRRRSERRRAHQGPIHRLLEAGADQQRNTTTRSNERGGRSEIAPTRYYPGADESQYGHEVQDNDHDDAGQWRSPSVHDGINWIRDQSGQ